MLQSLLVVASNIILEEHLYGQLRRVMVKNIRSSRKVYLIHLLTNLLKSSTTTERCKSTQNTAHVRTSSTLWYGKIAADILSVELLEL